MISTTLPVILLPVLLMMKDLLFLPGVDLLRLVKRFSSVI